MKKINRFRKIRKWGNSLVIPLSKTDVQDHNILPGDYADISDILILSEQLMESKREAKKNGN